MAVLEKRANLISMHETVEFASGKCKDVFPSLWLTFNDHENKSQKNVNDYSTSSERMCLSFMNPAFCPGIASALINAKELLKYAEKQIEDITNKKYEEEFKSNRFESSSKTDETLFHIQELINRKFDEINNPEKIKKQTKIDFPSSIISEPKLPKTTRSNQKRVPKCCNKIPQSFQNYFNANLSARQEKPKKIVTARGVQTSFEDKSTQKPEENEKCKKLQMQNAPSLTIPSALTVQKMKSVHISPDCSLHVDCKNVETYTLKYHDPHRKENVNIQKEDKSFKDNLRKQSLTSTIKTVYKDKVDLKVNKDCQKPKSMEVKNKIPSPDQTEIVIKEKKNTNVSKLEYQKIEFDRRKKKVTNKNQVTSEESSFGNISLETVHFSDVDNILKINDQKLERVTEKTTKLCKVLGRHVKRNIFRIDPSEKSSSTEQRSFTTLELPSSSNFNTSLEKSNSEKLPSDKKSTFAKIRKQLTFDSPSGSVENVHEESIVPELNLNFSSDEESIVGLSKKSRTQSKRSETCEIFNLFRTNSSNRVNCVMDEEVHVESDCNINNLVPKKNEEEGEICMTAGSIENSSGTQIDDIQMDVGQVEASRESGEAHKNLFDGQSKVESRKSSFSYEKDGGLMRNENRNHYGHDFEDQRDNEKNKDRDDKKGKNIIESHQIAENALIEKIEKEEEKPEEEMKDIVEEGCLSKDTEDYDERQLKHTLKFMDTSKILAEQISNRLNKEIKEIVKKTEEILKQNSSDIKDNCLDKRSSITSIKSSIKSKLTDYKGGSSSEAHSEGEVWSSSGCTHSLGEVKPYCTKHVMNSREICKLIIPSKTNNSSIDTSISSVYSAYSLGEICEKRMNFNSE